MNVQKSATDVVKRLKKAGYVAYFAGGWVRDYLLKDFSSDIDIATDAPPQVILDLFPHTILVGLSFGVVIVVYEGHQFEVATFRKDVNYIDGRKPEQIELSTALEDAKRRDFTINGMFFDPLDEEIYDFVGGTADLKKKIVRTIGNPHARFVEDRLRMIRAIRFACRFDFAIDQETQDAIAENAATLFPAVAMERIWQELVKMSATSRFDYALIEMHRLCLLPTIFPELEGVHLNEIKKRVSSFAKFKENTPPLFYLLLLFPNTSLTDLLAIFQRLRLSNKMIDWIALFDQCRKLINAGENADSIEWVHFYVNPAAQWALQADVSMRPLDKQSMILEAHYLRQESFQSHIQRLAQRSPLINSNRLKEEGISQGKLMGVLLKEAERLAVELDLQTSEGVMEALQNSPYWPKKEDK